MLSIHIAAGGLALLAGFAALYARKGGDLHRSWGRIFGYAMFAMTVSGAIIAALLRPNPGNVLAAATTFYLVATGWLAVTSNAGAAPRRHRALCALGYATGLYGLGVAVLAFQAPGMSIKGIPAVAMLIFALTSIAAATKDLRLLRGRTLDGARRLMRHLWRMGLAFWIATMSFFLGQADEFPKAVRDTGMLFVPVLLVTGTLLYWVVRQRLVSRRADRARLGRNVATA